MLLCSVYVCTPYFRVWYVMHEDLGLVLLAIYSVGFGWILTSFSSSKLFAIGRPSGPIMLSTTTIHPMTRM